MGRISFTLKDLIHSKALSPILNPIGKHYEGSGFAVMYHRIAEEPQSPFAPNRALSVNPDQFQEQVEFLSNNYECIHADQLTNRLRNVHPHEKFALITLDDGYLDNLTHALPILEKYNVPATIFVTTGFVDGTHTPWWFALESFIRTHENIIIETPIGVIEKPTITAEQKNSAFKILSDTFFNASVVQRGFLLEQMGTQFDSQPEILSWDDIKRLDHHPLITIGAHSVSHLSMARFNQETAAEEIEKSRSDLRTRLNHDIAFFAYPFGGKGHVNRKVINVAEAIGFEAAFTTYSSHIHPEHLESSLEIPRIMIAYDDDQKRFQQKLSGVESFFHQRGKRVVTV